MEHPRGVAVAHRSGRASAQQLVGSLEFAVLDALWNSSPASVGDVRGRLNANRDDELAYTTVMTVLTRLHDKELVERTKRGRGYDYTPCFTESELVAHLGRQEVDGLLDRFGPVAVSQFAAALQDSDPILVRQLLELVEGEDGDDVR